MMLDLEKRWWKRLVMSLIWLMAVAAPLHGMQAADNTEARNLFRTASEMMADRAFERAAGEFNTFIQKYPASPRWPEAVASLTEIYFELKQFDNVLRTVEAHHGKAGALSDRLDYLKARALWEKGEYASSAEAWRAFGGKHPDSAFVPEALYWEALAHFQQKVWPEVVQTLSDKNSRFLKLAEAAPANPFVIRARLLLAEAQLENNDYAAAEQTLITLAGQTLSPAQSWQRLQLQVRAQRKAGRVEEAAQAAIALVAQARAVERADWIAESVALRAECLQALKDYDAALEAWQTNLSESTPPERRRQALFAVIDLTTAKGNTEQARSQLAEFLKSNPNDPAQGMVRLTLGELALKDYYRTKVAGLERADTNLLQIAKTQFDAVLTNAVSSNITGRAHLGRGWYGWETKGWEAAQSDFKTATELLPESNDQAISRFKWADVQFLRGDLEAAAENYGALVEQYRGVAAVRAGLLDQALYQMVRIGVRLGRLETATYALERLLEWFPDRFYSENSLLLVGQALGRAGQIADARRLLDDFLRRFPDSAKASEIQLARARISVREQNWSEAVGIYTNWLGRFTNDIARPRAIFDLGWLQFKAGEEAAAYNTYTNFVTEFTNSVLVPQAHFWLAEHHERKKEYNLAETHYQLVYQNTNTPPGELAHRARLMAGRAAFSSQLYSQAEGYFRWLVTNGPPQVVNSTISTQLVAQAYFALGDTFQADTDIDPAKPLDRFGEAINAYELIPKFFPESPLVPLAWSKIASCHMQYAVQDTNRYSDAISYFTKAIESPAAAVETRALAEIGLAEVKEALAGLQPTEEGKAALWLAALEHHENVVYGKALKENEEMPSFAIEQAGREGARLLIEKLKRPEQAASFLRRVIEKVPALKGDIEKRLIELERGRTAARN